MSKSKAELIKEQLEEKYDKFAATAQEIYKQSSTKTKETLDKAIEKARQQLTDAGEFSAEQGKSLKEFLQRDLQQIYNHVSEVGEDAKNYLNPSRLGVGALSSLAALLDKAEGALHFLKEKTDKVLIYKTGEITTAGSLTCIECKKVMNLKKTGHVPPCPGCKGTQFRKGY